MGIELNPYIEQLSWAEARELILPINPEFVKHADELDLPESCCIFKVKYRYGDYLLQDGQFMLRNKDGQNVPLDHPDIPEILKKKLGYAPSVPMGININRDIEIFYKSLDDRIIPIVAPKPGNIFALTAVLSESNLVIDQGSFWNITAGSRSVYSIPKISLALNHRKLSREFEVSHEPPKNLYAQWEFFKELFQTKQLEDTWSLDVIYFSQEWVSFEHSTSWLSFNNHLRKSVWNNAIFLRNLYQASYIMSQATSKANIRCTPNIINTMKHILYVAGSFMPGLTLNGDELSFPKATLSMLYENIYGLEYSAQFMSPTYFNPQLKESLFYVLSIPTQLEHYLDNKPHKSKFDELRDLAYALKKITALFLSDSLGIKDLKKSIFKGIENAEMRCYHSLAQKEQDISQTYGVFSHENNNKKNCQNSVISRGMVGIHPKINQT